MKFIRYALGEILLVVIGILIALQINNWNEERVEQKVIREYALNLSDAIGQDMEMLQPVEIQIRAAIRQAEVMAEYLRDRVIAEIDNAEMFFISTPGYRPYAWNRAALEQLKASGGLRQMRNSRLVQLISDYDALTHHLDQDYREDEASVQVIRSLLTRLVDLNYPPDSLEDWVTWDDSYTEVYIERRLTGFRETDTFRRLAAMRRPLLSQDLAGFQRLANLCVEYADDTGPRAEIELPRLRSLAAEIQQLIEEEYR